MNEHLFPILHNNVTNPSSGEFINKGQGVALVIFNTEGEMLLLNQSDCDDTYGRTVGQWNILTETREEGEYVEDTMKRGILEELGKELKEFWVLPDTYRETNGIYEEIMGYPFIFRCLCLLYTGDPRISASEKFHSKTGEIQSYQWVSWDSLHEQPMEIGAYLVVEYYGTIFPHKTNDWFEYLFM